MDWVWWEAQHTHADWQTTVHAARTAHSVSVPMLVRTWTHHGDTIERLLDAGVDGIIVPMVDTAEQAEEIASRCYYPPLGNRSFGSIRMEVMEPDVKEWNKRIVTIMQVESPRSVENAEAIARVPGVDGLLVGARDLAMRRGRNFHGDLAHASVDADVEHIRQACCRAGKAAGIIALTEEDLKARIGEGYQLICAGMDLDHLELAYRRMKAVATEALRAGPAANRR
jgi:2-keto-3-deoxy-L-rhamnonate aldolase RhmA